MEVAAILGLAGLGYLVTQSTTNTSVKTTKKKEGFQSFGYPSPPGSPLEEAPAGSSVVASPTQLDQMFENTLGNTYPMQPNPPSAAGRLPTDFATKKPKFLDLSKNPEMAPSPESIGAARPSVAMNPARVEANPVYVDKDEVVSPLSGQRMPAAEFTHNNMQPFFGGRIKQNVAPETNASILDSYTGSGYTQIAKREVENMFETSKAPFGNPFGMEDNTEFFQSRMDDPRLRRRDGERPFEPVRIAPAIGEKFGATGKGGFQQFEVNEFMINNIRRTDDLRTSDNPKTTYKGVVVPGQQFIGKPMQDPGEVRKYRPDAFYIDEAGERFVGAFSEESQRETARPVQVMPYTSRTDTTSEFIGPAASQEFGENYVVGAYRTPMSQQYGGAGFRNADMQEYNTNDPDQPQADYVKSGY
jgi:hypothetical protein